MLGLLGDSPCHAVEVGPETQAPPGHEFLGLRSLFGRFDETLLAVAGRAFQIIDWDRTHLFCGRCGTPIRRDAFMNRSSYSCPHCQPRPRRAHL